MLRTLPLDTRWYRAPVAALHMASWHLMCEKVGACAYLHDACAQAFILADLCSCAVLV